MSWVAALPMYALSPELVRDSNAILRILIDEQRRRGWREDVTVLAPESLHSGLEAHWTYPNLFLSQTCGYPLLTKLADQVTLLATPHYDAPGCSGPNYSSALVVNAAQGPSTLAECAGRVAAVNTSDSNSGMNMFRHSVAPLAKEGTFFRKVIVTGSHVASLKAVADLTADVAAIDAVTLELAREHFPELVAQVRVIGFTAPTPSLPLICSRQLPEATIAGLREDLLTLPERHAPLLARLKIAAFSWLPLDRYSPILAAEQQAQLLGYAQLR
ncbi:phosphate/phosphite/phosphonate ABC transporter substrate-binding protein [Steroidobacter sp.]|uniref:phosphate/phosphite/phosphonate ABC transporter substrate-binding protein n=1 Tax=Steroidobacter sp. TaxID=1978227 RepID=UPI001A5FAEB1|nr:PhnD/SsuA/transferrin family substrate-binding protein [Steroidobacter sp.]MBL8269704.1 PhnD/SsuA/transferrin family substrate-binding protein [Steroidobacter sp.]